MKLTEQQKNKIKKLVAQGKLTKTEIATELGVNRTTVYYHLNPQKRLANTKRWYAKRMKI